MRQRFSYRSLAHKRSLSSHAAPNTARSMLSLAQTRAGDVIWKSTANPACRLPNPPNRNSKKVMRVETNKILTGGETSASRGPSKRLNRAPPANIAPTIPTMLGSALEPSTIGVRREVWALINGDARKKSVKCPPNTFESHAPRVCVLPGTVSSSAIATGKLNPTSVLKRGGKYARILRFGPIAMPAGMRAMRIITMTVVHQIGAAAAQAASINRAIIFRRRPAGAYMRRTTDRATGRT